MKKVSKKKRSYPMAARAQVYVCMHFGLFQAVFKGNGRKGGSAVEAGPVETFWKESDRVCKRGSTRHAPPASRGAADLQATASAADPYGYRHIMGKISVHGFERGS